jgi:hypothetical protein
LATPIAVDEDGNAYITGRTFSTDFPITPGAFQPTDPDPNPNFSDAFVTKLNRAGSALIYSTYLGGTGDDIGNAIAVDKDHNFYVTGRTFSANSPTTAGAFQSADPNPIEVDAFVTQFGEDDDDHNGDSDDDD